MAKSLKSLKAKAKREGWLQYIKTKSDEQALLDGCVYSKEHGEKPIEFFSYILFEGKPVELLDWQQDLVKQLFGWVKPDGTRRFKRLNCWLPKKQGKSFLCSLLCLYLLVADGEYNAEVANLASSVKQAGVIFDVSKQMVDQSPALKKRLTIQSYYKLITHEKSYSKYSILSKMDKSSEGFNFSGLVIDELHVCARKLYESLADSGISRKQPLFITISTAGEYDPASVAWEQWEWCNKILNGDVVDTETLPIVYAADPETDDPFEESTWFKANPSLGKLISVEDFRKAAYKAKNQPTALNNFLRRRLNIWVNSASAAISMKQWDKCNRDVDPDAWGDAPVYCGMDCSHNQDMTAFVAICETEEGKIEVFPLVWLPEDNITDRTEAEAKLYDMWSKSGLLRLTQGNALDEAHVLADITEFLEGKNVIGIGTDPYAAKWISSQLRDYEGYSVLNQRQGYLSMSPPIKEFEKWLLTEKLAHGGNELLRWTASNVKHTFDHAENIKYIKHDRKKRIDPIIALINAVAVWQNEHEFSGSSITFS